ncbi:unnamed protein product [Auanema sp. JU1783]|nr:unnamed protein product [Auanema sp. JU1783]
MSSLVSGNSILHIANRLSDLKKETPEEDEHSSHFLSSYSSPEAIMDDMNMKASVDDDDIEEDDDMDAPADMESCTLNSNDLSTDKLPFSMFVDKINHQPSSPSTSSTNHSSDSVPSPNLDLQSAVAQMQQQLLANQQNYGNKTCDENQTSNLGNDQMVTMRDLDLLPGYSPWLRNAGRKKSHPVWEFFKDLKDTNGAGGVVCLHCSWTGDDRSPNNLRTHLKKFHTSDGIFAQFSQKLAQTPTQPYVKRARAGASLQQQQQQHQQGSSSSQPTSQADDVALVIQQLQNAANGSNSLKPINSSPFNFLENLPKSNEVINISAGFIKTDEEDESIENANEPGSSGASASGERAVSDSPIEETSGGSPSVSSTNQLNAFMNMATNPLVWNAMLANSSHGSAFSLNDGQCVSMLMKMALDLDLTMSYHKRRGEIELCFESNRTAEKSGGRGKILCLSDMQREIRVTERVNGAPTDTELWTKTDFNQFHWAIRGKCQKVLVRA